MKYQQADTHEINDNDDCFLTYEDLVELTNNTTTHKVTSNNTASSPLIFSPLSTNLSQDEVEIHPLSTLQGNTNTHFCNIICAFETEPQKSTHQPTLIQQPYENSVQNISQIQNQMPMASCVNNFQHTNNDQVIPEPKLIAVKNNFKFKNNSSERCLENSFEMGLYVKPFTGGFLRIGCSHITFPKKGTAYYATHIIPPNPPYKIYFEIKGTFLELQDACKYNIVLISEQQNPSFEIVDFRKVKPCESIIFTTNVYGSQGLWKGPKLPGESSKFEWPTIDDILKL
ncbi:predicted protein [Naegleria gruberi]|uniref:Predicted protein n=1 Tax=Naegleria gruberi TaxID=5762 RepID=D2W6I6_NAEGR|nr:uncharacterized protein NAEGRDRAFT_77030 [Naegleria gruberi]EFC35316.1 predicted protein [Naegleria gruberi]|eukprot:XP_002668060.1 predicted protein [Naegleria gruberi strain NEG-M]